MHIRHVAETVMIDIITVVVMAIALLFIGLVLFATWTTVIVSCLILVALVILAVITGCVSYVIHFRKK